MSNHQVKIHFFGQHTASTVKCVVFADPLIQPTNVILVKHSPFVTATFHYMFVKITKCFRTRSIILYPSNKVTNQLWSLLEKIRICKVKSPYSFLENPLHPSSMISIYIIFIFSVSGVGVEIILLYLLVNWHNYVKSPFWMVNSTINGHVQ